MKPDKAAVIIRDVNNQWEGLRTSLGLGIEMIETHMFVLGKVRVPDNLFERYRENLAFLKDDLEGRHYTDNRTNVEKCGYFEYMCLEEIAGKLREYDLIIPF